MGTRALEIRLVRNPGSVSARLPGGRGVLQGSNGGEFGSTLMWKPAVGLARVIYQGYEVIGIFPDGDGLAWRI